MPFSKILSTIGTARVINNEAINFMSDNQIMDFDQWQSFYLERISELKRLSAIEKNILELFSEQDKTKIQDSVLQRLLNNEYRKYKTDEEFKLEQKKTDQRSRELLQRLRAPKRSARKQRDHELISIGALTDVIGFPKDRGTVAGALAYILEQANNDPNFLEQIKTKGDKIIHDREIKRKQEREVRRQEKEALKQGESTLHNTNQ